MAAVLRSVLVCVFVSACVHIEQSALSVSEIQVLAKNSKQHYVEELSREIAVFDNVAVGLGLPLRRYLNIEQSLKGKVILDLGTGVGVLSLIALKKGAARSVATDINSYAIANAIYNAEQLGFKGKMDVRPVSMNAQGAYTVINNNERFDLIVSNPPQRRDQPKDIYEYSHSDPSLAFFRSILEGLDKHLTPEGKGIFALYYRSLTLA